MNKPRVSKGKPSFDQFHMFTPKSTWTAPLELPDLSQEIEVAIDVETRDESLAKDRGPGFHLYERTNHNTGYICGISVAWRDQAVYLPIERRYHPGFQLETVQRWLKALAGQTHTNFVFHNFQYDWGWLEAVFGVPPPANIDDTAALASIINENCFSFSLDSLLKWQNLPGKDETLLKDIAGVYNLTTEKDIKSNIWGFDAKFVGPYAEQDAAGTLALAGKLRPLLVEEGLEKAYQVERDLMPVTLRMKQRGIRINYEKAEKLSKQIINRCDDRLFDLGKRMKLKITIDEIRSSSWLKTQFDILDIPYHKTLTGQASFEKTFMATHTHPFPREVHNIKHQYELADKFLKKFIMKYAHKGRVFPTVNQFQSETGGTRSHRFSYSDPALQQIPSRDSEWAPLIRSCFIPEDSEEWCSIDYRQQEYRLIVFVAELLNKRGAKQAANLYRSDPNTDFHDYVAKITRLERRSAKDVNFAKSYGAGVHKFSLMTGMGEEEAERVMNQYDDELPFVKEIAEHYNRYAAKNGYIKMIDGARNHFNLWELNEWSEKGPDMYACPIEQAIDRTTNENNPEYRKKWPKLNGRHPWYGKRIRRAHTHKAFNRMIQGSAARQIKKAMVNIAKAGYHSLLQLHDELGFSFSNRKHGYECAKIMEEAMPIITIPMTTDVEFGPSWGEVKK